MKELLNKVVELKTLPGEHHGFAKVVGYMEAPTLCLEFPDGHHGSWMASLCHQAAPLDEAQFWRQRAEYLEKQMQEAKLEDLARYWMVLPPAPRPKQGPLDTLLTLLREGSIEGGNYDAQVADAALLALPELEQLAKPKAHLFSRRTLLVRIDNAIREYQHYTEGGIKNVLQAAHDFIASRGPGA